MKRLGTAINSKSASATASGCSCKYSFEYTV
jgi:hypothetical protein